MRSRWASGREDEQVSMTDRLLSHSHFPLFQVRDLEERLVEKEHELKQMKRNLDESEGAIVQVNLIVSLPSNYRSICFSFEV